MSSGPSAQTLLRTFIKQGPAEATTDVCRARARVQCPALHRARPSDRGQAKDRPNSPSRFTRRLWETHSGTSTPARSISFGATRGFVTPGPASQYVTRPH